MRFAVIDTTHFPVPAHAPVQPVKADPTAGVAVKVTTAPWGYSSEQSSPQSIPGNDVTTPTPVPVFTTVNSLSDWNVAVTVLAVSTVTMQLPTPKQPPPDQPVNVDPADAAAASVTNCPLRYPSVQSAPQLIPEGELVTVPSPSPALETVSAYTRVKVAVTRRSAVIARVQVAVPGHADQPVNADPGEGVAVKVTDDARRYVWAQSPPQLIPGGVLVTVPAPSPVFSTVSRGSMRAVADEVAVAPSSSVTLRTTL